MLELSSKKECCGCAGCSQICPVDAIEMKMDKEGFLYPFIKKNNCINCGLCEKVCPIQVNYIKEQASPEVYAAVCKNEDVCRNSSSGGAFTAASNWILNQRGKIYGVKFGEDFSVLHDAAETETERNQFLGSKYVQSDTSHIYGMVESDLRLGKLVLFTGTPCQVETLLRYMKLKHVNVENLYTIDNICHGVASPMLWKNYIELLKQQLEENEKIQFITMRGKQHPWREQLMEVKTDKRDISEQINDSMSWNKLFRSLYATRPSCFACKFTSYKRPGDLTCADFWNYENANLKLDDALGVSLVLVNTEKGQTLLRHMQKDMNYEKSSKKACWQIHLKYPNNIPVKRAVFWNEYFGNGAEATLRKYLRGSNTNKMIRMISPKLRKWGLYKLFACLHYKLGKRNG